MASQVFLVGWTEACLAAPIHQRHAADWPCIQSTSTERPKALREPKGIQSAQVERWSHFPSLDMYLRAAMEVEGRSAMEAKGQVSSTRALSLSDRRSL